MNVLVDTSVWSLALRKKTITHKEKKAVDELKELIKEFRVKMIGPVRQELLSGISEKQKFESLKSKLVYFEDVTLNSEDYEKAAEIYNLCRIKGIQGSHTDFLICAVALIREFTIFTTDNDFNRFSKIVDIRLHKVRKNI